jgi:two-component system, response regulator YesN
MASKKKKTISDRVVEFVLNCSVDEFRNLTVNGIASFFHVNRCYLSRKFKSDKDFTLCEFLIREKLSRSVDLLRRDNHITIRALSAKMGFSNANYFIQIFKRYYGASPGRYREYISRSRD